MVIFLVLWGSSIPKILAASPPSLATPNGLSLAEIKITGSEFVMLQNNGAAIADLSRYWLYAFNGTNPLAAGVSSSTQQLPAAALAPGQTILLSAGGGATCGAAVTARLSVSLTDSGGFLEVVQTSLSGNTLVQTAGDSVSWSSGANAAAGMIANVPSNTADPAGAYYRYQNSAPPPAFLWQQADTDAVNSCQLNVKIGSALVPGPTGIGAQLLPGAPPPATIVQDDPTDPASATSGLPLTDIGLAAPIINELMPNPAAPQTDDEDEFVEIYNSNDVAFDLSGFKLQTGTTTLHNYTFPAGTSLAPKSFTAFFSIDTNMNLSNSGGQARLLDPAGNLISQSDTYATADDGQSWALANGTWYWTTTPTAGGANVIHQPLTVKALTTGTTTNSAAKKSAAAPKSASTAKVKAASTTANNSNSPSPAKNASPLHPLVLAAVGAGAVAYAAYEYRNDLRNRFYQLRRYRAARAAAGAAAAGAGDGGAEGRFRWWQDNLRSRFSSWFGK